jgi:hypothetical protein
LLASPAMVGCRLREYRGRVVGGKRFAGDDKRGVQVWRVETVE